MAKKRRNPNLSQAALERARAELYANGEVPSASAAPTPVAERKPAARPVATKITKSVLTIDDLREEYGYVLVDLRNMALLAGFLFVALVVAALVLI